MLNGWEGKEMGVLGCEDGHILYLDGPHLGQAAMCTSFVRLDRTQQWVHIPLYYFSEFPEDGPHFPSPLIRNTDLL